MSVYTPSVSFISAIALGVTTTVTFTEPCDFIVGEIVSFRVSPPSGTFQLNNVQAVVQSVNSNEITVDINSTHYTPFINLGETGSQFVAMVVPSASGIIPGSFPIQTQLADAFDNVPIN